MMPVPGGAARRYDLAGAVAAVDVVMQRAAFAQRHADQLALGGFGRLADRFRHFARLAMAEADAALLVADDDERGEAEAPAALHHLGDAVDMDELVDELAVALFAVALACSRCHVACSIVAGLSSSSLELQSAFARGIGQRLDAAVIEIAAAVEHDVLDALCCARSAISLPTALAAVDIVAPVLPPSRSPSRASRRQPASRPSHRRSPAHRCACDERNTDRRGRAVPAALARRVRTRAVRRSVAVLNLAIDRAPLLLLAFLAEDVFARVFARPCPCRARAAR